MCAQSLSHVWLFAIPWTVACQASLSVEFSRQQYWSGLLFPTPGNLPSPSQTQVSCISCIGRLILYHCATWEDPPKFKSQFLYSVWANFSISLNHSFLLEKTSTTVVCTALNSWKDSMRLYIWSTCRLVHWEQPLLEGLEVVAVVFVDAVIICFSHFHLQAPHVLFSVWSTVLPICTCLSFNHL